MQNSLPINENREFVRLYKKGRSFVTPSLVVYLRKNRFKYNRFGITTSKKIGKAVKRNRARRIIREAYRLLEPAVKKGYDFVFVARVKTIYLKTNDLTEIMRQIFINAGVMET